MEGGEAHLYRVVVLHQQENCGENLPLPGRLVPFQTFGTVVSVRVTIRRGHSGLRSVLDRVMRLFPTELGHFPPR